MLPSIISFDPGGTTGYLYRGPDKKIVRGELTGDHHVQLWQLLTGCRLQVTSNDPDAKLVILYEDFMYLKSEQKREKIVYVSKEYIGVIKLFAQTFSHAVTLRKHSSAPKDQFWDDKKLRAVGLWDTKSKHIRDATKHYLYYVTFELKDDRYLNMLREE